MTVTKKTYSDRQKIKYRKLLRALTARPLSGRFMPRAPQD